MDIPGQCFFHILSRFPTLLQLHWLFLKTLTWVMAQHLESEGFIHCSRVLSHQKMLRTCCMSCKPLRERTALQARLRNYLSRRIALHCALAIEWLCSSWSYVSQKVRSKLEVLGKSRSVLRSRVGVVMRLHIVFDYLVPAPWSPLSVTVESYLRSHCGICSFTHSWL